jgi:hypothetical protein
LAGTNSIGKNRQRGKRTVLENIDNRIILSGAARAAGVLSDSFHLFSGEGVEGERHPLAQFFFTPTLNTATFDLEFPFYQPEVTPWSQKELLPSLS